MGKFKGIGTRFMRLRIPKNYWQQDISRKQKLKMGTVASVITLLTAWLYYRSLVALIVLWPVWVWYYKNSRKSYIERRKNDFLLQFKDMIQSMAAYLNIGYSVENALKETQKEMCALYSEQELICKELSFMMRQIRVQIPIEQVMEEFAQRVKLEDVRNFATVFATAKRSGGDMLAIIRNTVTQIGDKIDVKREIDTLLAAKKYEFQVMSAIPYIIIAYMMISFPEFMNALYKNMIGIGVMSVCLAGYIGAYALGVKLIKIEV